MSSVDLLLPELNPRDATGVHSRHLRRLLESDGHTVRIVVERATSPDEPVTLLRRWKPTADLTILQHSIGSEITNAVVQRRVPVVLNYHNVTPPEFVEPWEPDHIAGLRWGRAQLHELAPLTRLGVADSEYNARDLRAAGIDPVTVSPVLFPVPSGESRGGSGVVSRVGEGSVVGESRGGSGVVSPVGERTVLFVGRLAPNKCQQDLVAAFAVLRELLVGESVRLVLVGGSSSVGFEAALRGLVDRLGVGDGVTFAGSVGDEELAGWYSVADVFVCLSEHEGFCVPLVEAMAWGVPVVAFGAAAVPETLAGAGVLLGDKSPVVVAEAVRRVLGDEGLRAELVARGRARVEELGPEVAEARMREVLAPLLAPFLHETTDP